jgi:outer membrane protein OmpA-like peptidoglycan-associated protein
VTGLPSLGAIATVATAAASTGAAEAGEAATASAAAAASKPGSPQSIALSAIASFRAASCSASAAPPALFVVLPSAIGKKIGGVVVSDGSNEATLDQSFAAAAMSGGALSPCRVSEASVDSTFHDAVAARPILPHHFVLYFGADGGRLTPQSLAQYHDALRDIAERRSFQIQVIGYSDSLGSAAEARQRSLAQATELRRLLTQDQINPRKISLSARGKLDQLVPTGDQVAEPRNRRVEIWVR